MTTTMPTQRPVPRVDAFPEVITRRHLPRFNSKRLSSRSDSDLDASTPASTSTSAPPATSAATAHASVDAFVSASASAAHASADALLADGVHAMNRALADAVESAMGTPIPSMDVRFHALTVRATLELPAAHTRAADVVQVPTLLSPLTRRVARLCARGHVVHKDILRNVTGAFRPGRVTLVLGHAGSGKSTLMKILSGRFPLSRSVEVSGEIRYNALARDEILDRLPRYVAYADQTDEHYGRMTVLETFQFAHACCAGRELPDWVGRALAQTSPEHHARALHAMNAHHRHAPELVVKKLGLETSKHAMVGDHIAPGVSVGEKKRVTVGEMAFGLKAVHLLDEIGTGLDAAAKFDIVDSMRSMAVNFNRTVVVSLSQPTPEILDLFDDIMVLNDGYVMYHGPRHLVLPYFQDLGFDCPPRKDVGDFLLELGTPKQYDYKNSRSDLVPFSPSEFATCFEQSEIYHATLQYLNTPHEHIGGASMPSSVEMKPFRQEFTEDITLLLRRQWLLTTRNKAFLIGRSFMVLLMGVLYGTTFWQLQDTNSQLVLGLLFSCSMFLSLGQAAQIAIFMNNRAVFYKQRGANFFRTSSYVLVSCIAQVPFALFETLLFGSILYWMGGYVALADRFVIFLVTLFLCQMCFTAFFFFLASAVPTMAMAQPVMIVSILIFTLFGGFLVTKNNIPSYFM